MSMSRSVGLFVSLLLLGPGSSLGAEAPPPSEASPALAASAPAAPGALPPSATADWLALAQRSIAETEYNASENGEGLQAPNRAHNLRTYFEPAGARVVDREAEGSPALIELRLTGLGRGDTLAAVPAGEVSHDGNRVEIRRPGLAEWYVNAPAGLEQGFTLSERPQGEGALTLELAVAPAGASGGGSQVTLRTPTGRRLRYAKLVVRDADDAVVPARLEVPDSGRVRLVVDESDARYPLVIDPLLTEISDDEIESDQPASLLGKSVAGAGDVNGDGFADVIVGAPDYDAGKTLEGAAFIFHGSATGIGSTQAPELGADRVVRSNQIGACLGRSVAGAGDVNGDGFSDVIIGADLYDSGQANEGAAFIFHGSASGIGATCAESCVPGDQDTLLQSNQGNSRFGRSVDGAGDVNGDGFGDVVVGAPDFDSQGAGLLVGSAFEGLVIVFYGGASGVADDNPEGCIVPGASTNGCQALGIENAHLGESVAGAGDVNGDGSADVIVGAPGYADEGAAYVILSGNAACKTAQVPKGCCSGPGTGNCTGILSFGGGGLCIGTVSIEAEQAGAELGASVSGAGDVNGDGYADVIVGSPLYDDGQIDEGTALLFRGRPRADFGVTCATSLGACGFVCVPGDADTTLESNQAGAQLGASVAGAGDANGDGYADVIIGADQFDAEGAAFVFYGDPAGIADGNPSTAIATLQQDEPGSGFGGSVAGAGDVNGDGFADVIAGAGLYDTGLENGACDTAGHPYACCTGAGTGTCMDGGAAFVYHGGNQGIQNADLDDQDWGARIDPNEDDALLGRSVAGAGDVNADGYADVIVGAPDYDAGGLSNSGAAFVFLGSASFPGGDPSAANVQIEGGEIGAELGTSVAGAGDVNGDGYGDVIVGAPEYNAGPTLEDAGGAFVYLGSASGIDTTGCTGVAPPRCDPSAAATSLLSNQNEADMGASVASAGDVDGDGYGDVIVGAPFYDAPESDEGAAWVFLGSTAGVVSGGPADAQVQIESDELGAAPGANLGASVASAGDVNADGYADVIVGAPGYGTNLSGAAFVYHGSAAGVDTTGCTGVAPPRCGPGEAETRIENAGGSAGVEDAKLGGGGQGVAGAGDVNADGFADVIVGAPEWNEEDGDEGAAWVYLGSVSGVAGGGVVNPPTGAAVQLEGDQGGSPPAFLGISVAAAGDVDGDGYGDVIVGADGYEDSSSGAAFVFRGASGGLDVTGCTADAPPRCTPDEASARFVNNEPDAPDAQLGRSVAGAGDINGDGFADVIAGAPQYKYTSQPSTGDEGAAFVLFGNRNVTGREVLATQRRADDSAEVAPWGTSGASDSFRVSLTATHPEGRGHVKAEIEYCPPGVPFGDASCGSQVSASWVEVAPPTPGADFTETITGLTADTLYRWRARVLHASASVTEPGITAPASPAHGPWRRVQAQSVEADIRTVPEPGLLVMLASGAVFLVALERRRRQR